MTKPEVTKTEVERLLAICGDARAVYMRIIVHYSNPIIQITPSSV